MKKNKTINKFLSLVALSAVFAGNVGMTSVALAQEAPPEDVQVHIVKYVDGEMATSDSANSSAFQMSATWSATNIGAGTGQYALDSGNSYAAETAQMSSGADYSTNEIFDSNVSASCSSETPFALVGYTSGDTLEEAQSATPTLTAPTFVGLTNDKYVIVWNEDCTVIPPAEFVSVQINKYIDGVQATPTSADNADFTMSATWVSTSHGSGTGSYSLSENETVPYQNETVDFNSGADYSTSETTNEVVGASCSSETPFALVGYTSGDTLEEAQSATPTLTAPTFVGLTNDKYVIVWNEDCTTTDEEGTIGGDVTGGQDANGSLNVDSIETVDNSATADGTFANGWKYIFHITAPADEPKISMKFSDWDNTANASIIPVANNVRISSAQADNSNATVLITAANVYSTPDLNMITDLDLVMPGIQFEILVEAAVPSNSVNGSYTTSYGVKSVN